MNVKEEKSIILQEVKYTRFLLVYQVKTGDLELSLPQVGSGHIRERRWHKELTKRIALHMCTTFFPVPPINLIKGKL